MSRSPWRTAIDGQAYVLRELHKSAAVVQLAQMFAIQALTTDVASHKREDVQMRAGAVLAEGLATLVRESEPVYLTHDILDHTWDRVLIRPNQLVPEEGTRMEYRNNDLLFAQITEDMLPIHSGFVWFGDRGYTLHEIPRTKDDPPDPRPEGVVIRAIYFGEEPRVVVRQSLSGVFTVECDTRGPKAPRTSMGITVFLDARRSGYVNMTREFGDHVVPVPLGSWPFGTYLREFIEHEADVERSEFVSLEGTKYLMLMSHGFLYHLFLLMLNRITLWGGVGLNRSEQQQAERDKLRPRVQLVTWRKAHYQYPEGHIPVPVSWSCRWSVREHYRRYKSGKVVKIMSYIKGPDDKPFRGPTTRAHQVKR